MRKVLSFEASAAETWGGQNNWVRFGKAIPELMVLSYLATEFSRPANLVSAVKLIRIASIWAKLLVLTPICIS